MATTTKAPSEGTPQVGRPVPESEAEALAAVEGAEPVGIPAPRGIARSLLSVIGQPGPLARETARLGRDTVRIVRGIDEIAPSPKDKRFADPAWSTNPGYRRLAQEYVAIGDALNRLMDEFEATGADWREAEQARFIINAVRSALAPTNTLLGNPAALKRAFDTGGRSLARGLRKLARRPTTQRRHAGADGPQRVQRRHRPRTDSGAVVHRTEVVEVLQYAPSTPTVRQRPLVVVPPPIGRYYFLDLRPGRSFIEYAVSQGFQVFLLSWRNPTKEHADWDLDRYAGAILESIDVVRDVTHSDDVTTLGFCAGGILAATVLNHLAAIGDTRVHSAGFAVTLLDFHQRAPIGAFSGPRMLDIARRNSRRKGVITAREMGAVFTWMRPDDLVFNYLVNQWLMGEDPPAFDILAWNADGTNLPARLHEQFLDIFGANSLVRAGAMQVLGTPVHLSRITVPAFVTGAVTDHLPPGTGATGRPSSSPGPAPSC